MGVGLRLKSILRDRKMTIKQLAEQTEIPVNTLYSITKRDSERVDQVILQRIAETLHVPVGKLLGLERIDDQFWGKEASAAVYQKLSDNYNSHHCENLMGAPENSISSPIRNELENADTENDPYVAVACAIPSIFHARIFSELEKLGISRDHITRESPRATIIGEGFIVDWLTPSEAKKVAYCINEYLQQLI